MTLRLALLVISTLLAWAPLTEGTDFDVFSSPDQEATKYTTKVFRKFIAENATIAGNIMKEPCSRQKACATVKGCQATSINVKTGSCVYHNSSVGLQFANGYRTEVTSLVSKQVCYGFRVWDGFQSTGPDLAVQPAAKYMACVEVCHFNTACRAFTWTSEKKGTCYLKDAWRGTAKQRGATMGMHMGTDDDACKDARRV